MTVYVDDMQAPYGRMVMCHMIADADAEAELHELAAKIGIARRWYQKDHYDICQSKRALAVKLGAVEITMKQCAAMNAVRRYTGKLGHPDTAIFEFRTRFAAKRRAA